MIATFIFVTVILCIKKYNPSGDGLINCGAIAMTLYGMIKMNGGITGGCFNPAVAIAQTTFESIMYKGLGQSSLPIYIFSSTIGGCLAGAFVLTKLKYSGEEVVQSYEELDAPETENLVEKTGRKMDASQNL